MNEAWKQASQNEALDDHNGSWSDVQHGLQMNQTQSRITTRELTYSRNCCNKSRADGGSGGWGGGGGGGG